MLLGKAYGMGHRIVLRLPNQADVARMTEHLWTFHPLSFLPHGTAEDAHAAQQPIILLDQDDNPNEADVLIIGQGVESGYYGDFKLCCEMLDGHDQAGLAAARTRWKGYKDCGFTVTYWQQSESGAWEKKA